LTIVIGEETIINEAFIEQLPNKNNNSQLIRHIGTTTIAKCIGVHTVHLLFCPYDENSTNETIQWKREVLFCSNAFKPG